MNVNLDYLRNKESKIKYNIFEENEGKKLTEYFKKKNGSELIIITPEEAKKFLKVNGVQRKLLRSRVDLYRKDMEKGLFKEELEDPIRFDSEGYLRDGQHRLTALIESKTPQRMRVIYGVPKESIDFIDVPNRTLADYLKINGYKYSNQLQGAIRLLALYESGKFPQNLDLIKLYGSVHQGKEILERNMGLINSVEVGSKVKILGPSLAAFFHYIFSKGDKEAADLFFEKLSTGEMLEEDSPIFVLRKKLLDAKLDKNKKYPRKTIMAFVIKAWNAFIKGEKVTLLVYRVALGEKFPEIMEN